jgi:hypothetical protein
VTASRSKNRTDWSERQRLDVGPPEKRIVVLCPKSYTELLFESQAATAEATRPSEVVDPRLPRDRISKAIANVNEKRAARTEAED